VFLDCEEVILVDVIQRGKTVNSDAYISALKKMRKHFQQVWPDKKLREMLLQHDNTRPHTYQDYESHHTNGWTMLLLPPYSPSLAPSDFHLFGPLKDAIQGRRFETDDDVVSLVRTCCINSTRNGPGRAYMFSFHTGTKL